MSGEIAPEQVSAVALATALLAAAAPCAGVACFAFGRTDDALGDADAAGDAAGFGDPDFTDPDDGAAADPGSAPDADAGAFGAVVDG